MRIRHIWMALPALLLALSMAGAAKAQTANPSQTFKLAAGGTATVEFESFCIDYGKKFPSQVGLPPTNVADPTVTGALSNALAKGYTSSNPKEVQFAIWKARGATGAPQPGAVGTEIAQNLTPPTTPAGATSIIDALASNQVKATAGSWQGVGEKLTIGSTQDNFQGRGQLTVENVSGAELTLYMPIGTVFPAPSAEFQSMAGYLVSVQTTAPAQASTAPQSSAAAQASTAPQASAAAAAQQAMPNTGIFDNGTQNLIILLMALDVAAIGILLQGRARTQR